MGSKWVIYHFRRPTSLLLEHHHLHLHLKVIGDFSLPPFLSLATVVATVLGEE